MHKKQFYEAPDAELLVVKFEENIMSNTGESLTNNDMNGEFTEDGD